MKTPKSDIDRLNEAWDNLILALYDAYWIRPCDFIGKNILSPLGSFFNRILKIK